MVSSNEYGFDFTHYLAIITLGQQAINLIIKPIKKKVKLKNLDELTEKEYNKLIKLAGESSGE